jgi:hypothetical protein
MQKYASPIAIEAFHSLSHASHEATSILNNVFVLFLQLFRSTARLRDMLIPIQAKSQRRQVNRLTCCANTRRLSHRATSDCLV